MTPIVKLRLEVRTTQVEDLDPVLSNLAERTLREIDRYLRDVPAEERPEMIRAHVMESIEAGRSDTLMCDDAPLGIMTHTPELDYHYTTALPTEAFFDRKYLRLSRSHCATLAKRVGTDLRAYSRSDHPDVDSWFRLLGFNFEGMDTDARVYIHRLSGGNSTAKGQM